MTERFEKSIYKRGRGLELLYTSDDHDDGKVYQLCIHTKGGGAYARFTLEEILQFFKEALTAIYNNR